MLTRWLAILPVAAALLGACAEEEHVEADASGALSDAEKAARGYDFIVNGDYIGCGLPMAALERLDAMNDSVLGPLLQPIVQTFLPLASGDLVGPASGVEGRKGPNENLSFAFNAFPSRNNQTVVSFNCLSCHAQRLGDEVVVGLGSTTRDFTEDLGTLVDASWTLVREREKPDWDRWAQAMRAIAPYVKTETVGVNPAVNLTYALFAHRVPETLAWSDTPLIDPPERHPLPADVPPWWRTAKRTTAFYSGEFKFERHLSMMLSSTLCTDSVEKVAQLKPRFKEVEAYLKTIKAPRYPGMIDPDLADYGETVYSASCATCHGTYGSTGHYTEVFTKVSDVGTDPELAALQMLTGPNRRFGDWFRRSPYGEGQQLGGERAYLAPPLDGIWATAPYLHNGSVPTMEGVLNSRARPRYWRRTAGAPYDVANMMWPHVEVDALSPSFLIDRKWTYDTDSIGYGNGGHTYGDSLSAADRSAVIEYLKTL